MEPELLQNFISNLSRIAQPLLRQTTKGSRWTWTTECQVAFDSLRRKLTEEPVCLAFPDWKKEMYVESDASNEGVAAERHRTSGIFKPISFFSSALSNPQNNYSAGQLGAWALMAATGKWAIYLKSTPKVVLLSPQPSPVASQAKRSRHTFVRWIMELEEIPYSIEYRPETQNLLPDYLSRKPNLEIDTDVNSEEEFEEKIYAIDMRLKANRSRIN